MDADSQARGGRGGRSGGVPNYKNDILIKVVELYLPAKKAQDVRREEVGGGLP
jgi:hypothetical protein